MSGPVLMRTSSTRLICSLLLFVCSGQLHAQNPLARSGYLLDGRRVSVNVVWSGGDEGWQAVMANGEEVSATLVMWGQLVERSEPTLVFADGEVIVDFLSLSSEQITVGRDPYEFSQRPLWHERSLPRQDVRGFVFQWPVETSSRDQLRNALAEDSTVDRVWFVDGEYLDGEIVRSVQEGGRTEELQLRRGERTVAVALGRVRAIRFASKQSDGQEDKENRNDDSNPGIPSAHCQVGFQDGSYLDVSRLKSVDDAVEIVMRSGVRLSLSASTFRRAICFFRPVREDVLWLAEIVPLDVRHVPFFSGEWPLGRNVNLWGGRLRRRDNEWYDHGLAMHSTTRVAYVLDEPFSYLRAQLALDVTTGQRGSVRYSVFTRSGDEDKWKSIYRSPVVRGGQTPLDLNLALDHARQLALIVEYADQGDQLDRACWFSARLVRDPQVER